MVKRICIWLLGLVLMIALEFMGTGAVAAADYLQEQKFFTDVWQIVNHSYVDSTFNHQNWYKVRKQYSGKKFKSREETYDAIQEMLATLDDPFTRLLRPDQFRSMQTSTSGALTGVGLQIVVDADTKFLTVVAPIEGSPAAKADVRSLDQIIKINNLSTQNLSLDECADRLRGEIGSEVTLTIRRDISRATKGTTKTELDNPVDTEKPSPEIFDVVLKRDRIAVNPVIYKLNQEGEQKIGYIRLNQFNGNAVTEMAEAIKDLEARNTDSYVLDLRSNPGGLLQAGIEIARMWLPKGVIVYTADRQGIQESFTANDTSPLTLDPLVILTDGGTASASEVLSGALHDNGRARLLGTRTYGKGLVQSLFTLEDGAGLAVTIAHYQTPNHTDIHKSGIQPDVEVIPANSLTRNQLGTKDDNQYVAAVDLLLHQDAKISKKISKLESPNIN
ncbi:C-terminal processing peptidase [Synechococcus sp. PCC 7502]|uniref:S41 family peptidase n=1 Tax=Synechococcus sp. PCC 7502 TaxID=1173263 RepID=UPI00029F9C2D|nr:S41 family peptidase [Synechococcus sp. PCC 7502]AFY75185.1 C-terminal processing peptidase [Synechococcus sp. PCC 7502]